MDILGDILSTLNLSSTLYFRAELTAPYAIAVPGDREVIRFHLANEGPCWIELPTGESERLSVGDIVLVPHGAAHVLADSPRPSAQTPAPLPNILAESGFDGKGPLVFGGGGGKTVLVCGHFSFAQEIMHPMIASLPTLIHIKGDTVLHYAWLEHLLAYMETEARLRPEAWAEVIKRISEIIFIYVLREYMGKHPNSTGALMALVDPQLGKALQAIHAELATQWTLDALAVKAGMSKTVFTERFRDALGLTPARYATSWRMHKARALLDRSNRSIREIAAEVGYESEAAFNRVFKEHFGIPPGRYRRALEPGRGLDGSPESQAVGHKAMPLGENGA